MMTSLAAAVQHIQNAENERSQMLRILIAIIKKNGKDGVVVTKGEIESITTGDTVKQEQTDIGTRFFIEEITPMPPGNG